MPDDFTIEMLDPRTLKPHLLNFRRHPSQQMDALRTSIDEHGWLAAPICNRRTGMTILDGHARVEYALGREETIPVRVVDVPEEQERRILASFDRVGELRERDDDALVALLQECAAESGLPPGWGDDDLSALLAGLEPESGLLPEADPDAIPEQVETRCKPGELWALGEHRLFCGDNSDPVAVAACLAGEKVRLLFTSPPYDHQREYEGRAFDWDATMHGAFTQAFDAPETQVLVNLGLVHRDGEWQPYWDPWVGWMQGLGWRRFGLYVWDQGSGLPGDYSGRLAPSFELLFHFNRESVKVQKTKECVSAGTVPSNTVMRSADGVVKTRSHAGRPVQSHKIPDSVIRVNRQYARDETRGHPAVFPIALASEMVAAFSVRASVVYDPFGGSGTTLLACEQLQRRCGIVEIEPKYCDVILARWERATGKEAVLTDG